MRFALDNGDDVSASVHLHARGMAGTWNGYARPVVTAADFSRYVDESRAADPNGAWGSVHVDPVSGALVLDRSDSDEESETWGPAAAPCLARAGVADDGTPLYVLDGWAWVPVADPWRQGDAVRTAVPYDDVPVTVVRESRDWVALTDSRPRFSDSTVSAWVADGRADSVIRQAGE